MTEREEKCRQLKEKCREYNISLNAAFVYYEKAFDPVQNQAMLTSLQEQGIEDVYIVILKYIYIYGQLNDSTCTKRVRKSGSREE